MGELLCDMAGPTALRFELQFIWVRKFNQNDIQIINLSRIGSVGLEIRFNLGYKPYPEFVLSEIHLKLTK